MSEATDVYPGIEDWDRAALDLIPGAVRAGAGAQWFLGLVRPLADTELTIEGIAREVADIEIAGTYVATMQCIRYGLNPAGMEVHELRRLAAGAAAALASDGTDGRLWAMWTALTGSTNGRHYMLRSNTTANYSDVFEGRIGWEPSRQWLAQAGRIVGRCIEAGSEAEAHVYLGGEFRFDGPPSLDAGVLAYTLPVT